MRVRLYVTINLLTYC